MSTTEEYIRFILDQLRGIDNVTCKRMFGEYRVYVEGRPVLLVCDNCVMVKMVPELAEQMRDAPVGIPYDGAKAHYLLDTEDRELTAAVIETLVRVTPVPQKRKRAGTEGKVYGK